MDPDAFSASLFKWDPRGAMPPPSRLLEPVAPPQPPPSLPPPPPPQPLPTSSYSIRSTRELGGLEELFQAYGIRYYTAAKIAELGFTVNTLLDMKDEELDDMMNSLSQIFRWDLLVGERYGIKAAIRAEWRRLEEEEARRRGHILSDGGTNVLDALSQEGTKISTSQLHALNCANNFVSCTVILIFKFSCLHAIHCFFKFDFILVSLTFIIHFHTPPKSLHIK